MRTLGEGFKKSENFVDIISGSSLSGEIETLSITERHRSTPGLVMSMSAEMREKGVVDIEDVKRCVQGNLCRCTGYRPIVQGFGALCGEGGRKGSFSDVPDEVKTAKRKTLRLPHPDR